MLSLHFTVLVRRNIQRALALGYIPQLILYFFLAYTCKAAAFSLSTACLADSHLIGGECAVSVASVNVAYWSLCSAFALYAGYRRHQIRMRFNIAGSECGDYCAWLLCPLCALCQETRTLAHNRVEQGHWLGPAQTAGPYQDGRDADWWVLMPSPGALPAVPQPAPGTYLVAPQQQQPQRY